MNSKILEFCKVSKFFSDSCSQVKVLNEANFNLAAGESALLLGASGIGKTTVLQIASLICNPTSGTVKIEGIECKNDKQKTQLRKENIGFIYQFHHLLPEFTVIENVMLPLLINKKGYKFAKKEAELLLKALEISGLENRNINEISGGQRQRAAIARAIIHRPKLIIADEPTGNLDEKNAENIFGIMLNLVKSIDCALLVASHNALFLPKCDYKVEIADGKLHKM